MADTTAPEPREDTAVAEVLARVMGCGPGEMLTDTGPDPYTHEPIQIAVGQMCKSNAHNHAYWDGTCEFAHNLAEALAPLIAERVRAAAVGALREAADLVNAERTAHVIASTRAPAAGALFRAEQAILARADRRLAQDNPGPAPAPDSRRETER